MTDHHDVGLNARRLADTPQPPLDTPRRARLILDFEENGECVHSAEEGWAQISDDGAWVLWLEDGMAAWSSWPRERVLCIDWVPDWQLEREAANG